MRTVQAQGGRDATFYLPTFILYYTCGIPARPHVTHVMIRALPDMLTSYLEELEDQPVRPNKWLNIKVPSGYPGLSAERKGDITIDMILPWYVSLFSTWLDYSDADARVLILDCDEFRADPAANLERVIAHSRIPRSLQHCQVALNEVWKERASFRHNKGVSGRG